MVIYPQAFVELPVEGKGENGFVGDLKLESSEHV